MGPEMNVIRRGCWAKPNIPNQSRRSSFLSFRKSSGRNGFALHGPMIQSFKQLDKPVITLPPAEELRPVSPAVYN